MNNVTLNSMPKSMSNKEDNEIQKKSYISEITSANMESFKSKCIAVNDIYYYGRPNQPTLTSPLYQQAIE